MLHVMAAMVAMTVRDFLGVFLTVAESRGRAKLAGLMDALGDLASIGVTVLGAGPVIQHGVTPYTVVLVACICVTSFFGTVVYTRLANRIKAAS